MISRINIQKSASRVNQLIGDMPHWFLRLGIPLIFGLIAAVVFYSFYIRYPQSIESGATINRDTYRLSAPVTGRVEYIFVRNQDSVAEMDVLAIMADKTSYAEIIAIKKLLSDFIHKPGLQEIDEIPHQKESLKYRALSNDYNRWVAEYENYLQLLRLKSDDRYAIRQFKNLMSNTLLLSQAISDWENSHVIKATTNGRVLIDTPWITGRTFTKGEDLFGIIPEMSTFSASACIPSVYSGSTVNLVSMKLYSGQMNKEFIIRPIAISIHSSIHKDSSIINITISDSDRALIEHSTKELKARIIIVTGYDRLFDIIFKQAKRNIL